MRFRHISYQLSVNFIAAAHVLQQMKLLTKSVVISFFFLLHSIDMKRKLSVSIAKMPTLDE